MTLFFPESFPKGQAARDYIFSYNKTHIALPLDYGSIMNHHESFNAEPIGLIEDPDNFHFQVRSVFQSFKNMQHINAYIYKIRT